MEKTDANPPHKTLEEVEEDFKRWTPYPKEIQIEFIPDYPPYEPPSEGRFKGHKTKIIHKKHPPLYLNKFNNLNQILKWIDSITPL